MLTSSQDPNPCWAFWLLGFTSILFGICSTGAMSSEVKGLINHVYLRRIQGDSVLFHVTEEPGAELKETTWMFGPELKTAVLLKVRSEQADSPTWHNLQDKYKQRVRVPNMTSLCLENLTLQDSGQYRARINFVNETESTHVFYLTVYEPVPLPEILVKSQSSTSSWCNITLECRATGATADLNVTWRSSGLLPRDLGQRTLQPAPSTWALAVNLPLTQPNARLTCIVSNHVGLKNASKDLGEICASQTGFNLRPYIIAVLLPILLTSVVGLYFWKTHWKNKKMETGRGAGLEEDLQDHDDSIHYAEMSKQEPREHRDKDISEHLEEKKSLTTIYSEISRPGQANKII